jgi:signal recognition particle GTPase
VAETSERCASLADADVNFKTAKTFTDTVKQKALGMNVLSSVRPGEMMIKLVHDELVALMEDIERHQLVGQSLGHPHRRIARLGKNHLQRQVILMLQSKKGRKPLLIAADVYRPAAIEQLRVLAAQIQVPVYTEEAARTRSPSHKTVSALPARTASTPSLLTHRRTSGCGPANDGRNRSHQKCRSTPGNSVRS